MSRNTLAPGARGSPCWSALPTRWLRCEARHRRASRPPPDGTRSTRAARTEQPASGAEPRRGAARLGRAARRGLGARRPAAAGVALHARLGRRAARPGDAARRGRRAGWSSAACAPSCSPSASCAAPPTTWTLRSPTGSRAVSRSAAGSRRPLPRDAAHDAAPCGCGCVDGPRGGSPAVAAAGELEPLRTPATDRPAAPRRRRGPGTRSRTASSAAGTTLSEPSSSGAICPAPALSANRGTVANDGRCSWPASASVNSALVGVCGQQRLNGPEASVVLGQVDDGAHPVAQRDHRHVLAAVAEPAAQAGEEQQPQLLERRAAPVHDRRGAQDADPGAGLGGRLGGGLPVPGHLGEQRVAAAVGGLVERPGRRRRVVAVVGDAVAGEERRPAVRRRRSPRPAPGWWSPGSRGARAPTSPSAGCRAWASRRG